MVYVYVGVCWLVFLFVNLHLFLVVLVFSSQQFISDLANFFSLFSLAFFLISFHKKIQGEEKEIKYKQCEVIHSYTK